MSNFIYAKYNNKDFNLKMSQEFFELPSTEQSKLIEDAIFKYYGVTVPVTTDESKQNLEKAKVELDEVVRKFNEETFPGPVNQAGDPVSLGAAANSVANSNKPISSNVIGILEKYLPSGYSFNTGTVGKLDTVIKGVQTTVSNTQKNPLQLPPMGSTTTYNPTSTTPPIGTSNPPAPVLRPTNTQPKKTSNPSKPNVRDILIANLAVNAITGLTTSRTASPSSRPAVLAKNKQSIPPVRTRTGVTPPPNQPINGLDLPPGSGNDPFINGLDLPPEEPINGLDLPDPGDDPFINGLDLPNEEPTENLAPLPVLSEDGREATGIAINPETGETFFTEPVVVDQEPENPNQAFLDANAEPLTEPPIDEFEGVDEAIAAQENVLQEPPVLSDEEVSQTLNQQAETETENLAPLPVLNEDGTEATGVAINPETGEVFYTDPPNVIEEPENPNQAFLDANAEPLTEPPFDEFEGVDEAVAAQENGLQEPPLLSDEEVEQYLNETETPDYDTPPDVDANEDPGVYDDLGQEQENFGEESEDPGATGSARGLTGRTIKTRQQATAQDNANYKLLGDWRVRLSLAPGSQYLYNATPPGILAPLNTTQGVIFPYTPTINVSYIANYDPTELVHSNYKVYQYRSSAVDSINIVGDFTAQDTFEANYVLAVIHFFRSITKMFYGQDNNPVNGTPPPLCYLYGYGAFGFDKHPLVITNFTSTFPNDVDYIRATTHEGTEAGVNVSAINVPYNTTTVQGARMGGAGIMPGAAPQPAQYSSPEATSNNTGGSVEPTYVPTKLQIQIQASPIISRNDISRRFSLRDYATGKLLRGSQSATGGGIW